jgi:hypothetical protein
MMCFTFSLPRPLPTRVAVANRDPLVAIAVALHSLESLHADAQTGAPPSALEAMDGEEEAEEGGLAHGDRDAAAGTAPASPEVLAGAGSPCMHMAEEKVMKLCWTSCFEIARGVRLHEVSY